ncbi:ABC transporter ATP-binding protein [bacterium]|nr:ABC transporter ATP-binding protein [bacterium]
MIKVEKAGFRFKDSGWIFRNHSFHLKTGETMAILGPNGRGKTTLLKSIIGLLKITQGKITKTCDIGVVHQYSQSPFSYNVIDMVIMGRARHLGMFSSPTAKDKNLALEALELLGLIGLKDREFSSLSGGEKQLVLIARAMASGCNCLILDEPASALDFKNQDIILKTLRDITHNKNMSVLFTTHYPQHALHIADKVLLMYSPDRYEFGAATEIMDDSHLKDLYRLDIQNVHFNCNGRDIHTVVPVFS